MEMSKIYVGTNGSTLRLTSGSKVVAICPAGKDGGESYALLDDGRVVALSGSMVALFGTSRDLAERGFVRAEPGNALAERLIDRLEVLAGVKLVAASSAAYATSLTATLGGMDCTFVPFDSNKRAETVRVKLPTGLACTVFNMSSGFCSAQVPVVFTPGAYCALGANLSLGWLVDPNSSQDLPRSSTGDVVELAMLTIGNSGLGTVVTGSTGDELGIVLHNGDKISVEMDASGELCVKYTRGNALLYSRQGLQGGRSGATLGGAIGAIAAVIVRVQAMDADLRATAPVPLTRKAG